MRFYYLFLVTIITLLSCSNQNSSSSSSENKNPPSYNYSTQFIRNLKQSSNLLDNYIVDGWWIRPENKQYELNIAPTINFEETVDETSAFSILSNENIHGEELDIFSPDEGYKLITRFTHSPAIHSSVYKKVLKDSVRYYPSFFSNPYGNPSHIDGGEVCVIKKENVYGYLHRPMRLDLENITPIYGFIYCLTLLDNVPFDVYLRFYQNAPGYIERACFLPKDEGFQKDCLQDMLNNNYTYYNMYDLRLALEE